MKRAVSAASSSALFSRAKLCTQKLIGTRSTADPASAASTRSRFVIALDMSSSLSSGWRREAVAAKPGYAQLVGTDVAAENRQAGEVRRQPERARAAVGQ